MDVACLVLEKARDPKQLWHCPLSCLPSRGRHPEPAPQDPNRGSELREPQKENEGSLRMAQGGEELCFPWKADLFCNTHLLLPGAQKYFY